LVTIAVAATLATRRAISAAATATETATITTIAAPKAAAVTTVTATIATAEAAAIPTTAETTAVAAAEAATITAAEAATITEVTAWRTGLAGAALSQRHFVHSRDLLALGAIGNVTDQRAAVRQFVMAGWDQDGCM
jgi:hypothetical protein